MIKCGALLIGVSFLCVSAADQNFLQIKVFKKMSDAALNRNPDIVKVPITPDTQLRDIQDYIAKEVGPGYLMFGQMGMRSSRIDRSEYVQASSPVNTVQNPTLRLFFVKEITKLPSFITITYFNSRQDALNDNVSGTIKIPLTLETRVEDIRKYVENKLGPGSLRFGSSDVHSFTEFPDGLGHEKISTMAIEFTSFNDLAESFSYWIGSGPED